MGEAKNDKNEDEKGFVVRDKRSSSMKEENETPQPKKEEEAEKPPVEKSSLRDEFLPEIDFTGFIFSLSTSVLIHLGEIQDPMTDQSVKNLPLAKQTIDLIGMLQEKTKGNLTADEENLVEHVLYDLRMRYVKAVS